jgi:hypothetical protein
VISKSSKATNREVKNCPRQQSNQQRWCNDRSKNQQVEDIYQIGVSQAIQETTSIENAKVNKVSEITDQVTESATDRNHPD